MGISVSAYLSSAYVLKCGDAATFCVRFGQMVAQEVASSTAASLQRENVCRSSIFARHGD